MPNHGDIIGQVVDKGLGSYLWEIPAFSGLPKEEGKWLCSPLIHLAETEWYLYIHPNGTEEFPDQILLELRRLDGEPAKTYHCRVGVRRADGEEEQVGTQTVKFGDGYVQYVLFSFYKQAKVCEEGVWLASDTLTLTLCIREEGEAESQGPSCAAPESYERKADISDVWSDEENKDENGEENEDESGVMILSKHMKELLVKGDDCDVIIRVTDKEFPVHRNILKSRSPVFRMMLTHECEENNSGVISIEDCDTDAFEEFLSYMYCGKTGDLTPNKAINLYFIADKYMFPELKKQCVIFLKTSLSTSNICDIVLLSAKHGEKDLLDFATNFFAQNIDEILVKVEWRNFVAKHPTEANELYIKSLLHIRASYEAS